MNGELHALCLSATPGHAADVAAAIAGLPGFAVKVRQADYEEGLRHLRDPDLAIVILGTEPEAGLSVIEEIHRSAPSTRVLALSPDENPALIIKAMRAGADEFLPLPATANALLKVCIKVSETRGCNRPSPASPRGEIWTAFSPKGGVGVTTLVANLAFALRAAQRDAALVDLDLYAGDLAVFLNITPTYTLRDISDNFRRLDSVFLQGTMSRHPSGLELLAALAPAGDEPLPVLSGEQTRAILALLRNLHEVTLVDAGSVPSEAAQAALTSANRVLLVTELTIPALRSCLRTLDWLKGGGMEPAKVVEIVINKHANKAAEVPPAEAAKTLKLPIRAMLPWDDVTAIAAVNSGLPLREVRANAALTRAIAELATPRTPAAEGGAKRKSLLRLFKSAEKGT
jgi:pilus assembly protein CpaE